MDNIQKMIVGSLGLVGLVVMVVPNADPLASKKAEAEQAAAMAPPVSPPAPLQPATAPNAQPSGGFVVDDSDIANFGKPMVDPTPPAERNQNPVQEQIQQPKPANDIAQPQNSPGNFGQPPIIGRTPAPVAAIPPST